MKTYVSRWHKFWMKTYVNGWHNFCQKLMSTVDITFEQKFMSAVDITFDQKLMSAVDITFEKPMSIGFNETSKWRWKRTENFLTASELSFLSVWPSVSLAKTFTTSSFNSVACYTKYWKWLQITMSFGLWTYKIAWKTSKRVMKMYLANDVQHTRVTGLLSHNSVWRACSHQSWHYKPLHGVSTATNPVLWCLRYGSRRQLITPRRWYCFCYQILLLCLVKFWIKSTSWICWDHGDFIVNHTHQISLKFIHRKCICNVSFDHGHDNLN